MFKLIKSYKPYLRFLLVVITLTIIVLVLKSSRDSKINNIVALGFVREAAKFTKEMKYDSATFYYDKAGQLYKENSNWDRYLDMQYEIGWILIQKGNFDDALINLENILLSKKNSNWDRYLEMQCEIGWILIQKGNLDNALIYLENILLNSKEKLDPTKKPYAKIMQYQGVAYALKGEYSKAYLRFISSLSIYSSFLDESKHIHQIQYTLEIMDRLINHSLPEESQNINDILKIQMELEDVINRGVDFYGDSWVYRRFIDASPVLFSKSIETNKDDAIDLRYFLSNVISLREHLVGANPIYFIEFYDSIGQYFLKSRDYPNALMCYKRVLDFKRIDPENKYISKRDISIAYLLKKIGDVYYLQLDYNNAALYYYDYCLLLREIIGFTNPNIRYYPEYYRDIFTEIHIPDLANKFDRLLKDTEYELSLMRKYKRMR